MGQPGAPAGGLPLARLEPVPAVCYAVEMDRVARVRKAQQQKRIEEQRRYHEMMANTVCWGGATWALLEGGAARLRRGSLVTLPPHSHFIRRFPIRGAGCSDE